MHCALQQTVSAPPSAPQTAPHEPQFAAAPNACSHGRDAASAAYAGARTPAGGSFPDTGATKQSAWAAGQGQVTGSITANVVTVTNSTGAALYLPLTGTAVGSPYAGGRSGWTLAPAGTSTYTALATWPVAPTNNVIVMVPFGPKPTTGGRRLTTIAYVAVQAKPKSVRIKRRGLTVSLSCQATRGRTARGRRCAGSFKLTLSRHALSHKFSFKSGKVDRITLKLPKTVKRAATVARRHKHHELSGRLVITTRLTGKSTATRKGRLTVHLNT